MASANTRKISELLLADPSLPRADPTPSYWQHELHPLAEKQSASLPSETDVVIIGSGMTGLGVARTLLEKDQRLRVAVLEARTLCSGATGRNGGQLAINAAETYEHVRAAVGPAMAGKIVQFTIRTLERVKEVVQEYGIQEADLGDVLKLRACMDEETVDKMKRGISLIESDHPSLKGIYQWVDADACVKDFGVHGALGGATLQCGVLWPYRLVCSVFQVLLDRFPDRLAIETKTTVRGVTYEPSTSSARPYIVQTSRGTLRAAKVVYCTNGHTGHLLPKFRGLLFPVTGTMTVQDLEGQVPNRGSYVSWAIHKKSGTDEDGLTHDGLQYLAQNAKSGYFFIGGDKSRLHESLVADDTRLYAESVNFLQKELQSSFGAKSEPKIVSAWSGVMCFSADGVPVVGRIPETLTGRQGND